MKVDASNTQLKDDAALWAVTRDGATTETYVTGYNDGDRGLVAHDFAGDDFSGWADGTYDELLWVRRVKPDPEEEPGQAIRVRIGRVRQVELDWPNEDERESGARSERRKGGQR